MDERPESVGCECGDCGAPTSATVIPAHGTLEDAMTGELSALAPWRVCGLHANWVLNQHEQHQRNGWSVTSHVTWDSQMRVEVA